MQKEVDASQKELNKLNDRFEATYQAYCYRLRVMYISGEYSIISALLGCKDIFRLPYPVRDDQGRVQEATRSCCKRSMARWRRSVPSKTA